MKLLAEKKINPIVAGVALYLSFCAANFYYARGNWAYTLSRMSGIYTTAFLSNPILAFFTGGLLGYLFYELCTNFMFRFLPPKLGFASDDMKYELRFFYIASNCAVALLSLFYLISPIISVYGSVFAPVISSAVFSALYIAYAFKRHIEKGKWGGVLIGLGGVYLTVYTFITVLNIFGVA